MRVTIKKDGKEKKMLSPINNEFSLREIFVAFFFFLLRIFLDYISNAIPKVPTHSHFLALAFPCTGAYKVCLSNGPLFPVMAD